MEKKKEDKLIKAKWEEYKASPTKEIRNELIINYSPLVKYVAGRVASNLPKFVDISDLISYGMFGLIDAIGKFDITRDIKFETYAITRIKGAIIDELRNLDWVPRTLRSKARDIENKYQELENKLKREPNDNELAESLNITLDEFYNTLSQLSRSSVIALEDLITSGSEKDDKSEIMGLVEDHKAADPVQLFEDEEVKSTLLDSIKKLPEREKTVIALYYYETLTLKEIGEILSISESRTSQLHAKALLRLRVRLKSRIKPKI